MRIVTALAIMLLARLAGGDTVGARSELEGVRCQPGSPDVHEALGDIYVAVGDPGSASNAYARAIALNPSDQGIRAKREKLKVP